MAQHIDYQSSPPQVLLEDLGSTIARIRLAHNITQKDLAERAGISESTLKRLEAGSGGTLDSFVRLLQALNLGQHLAALLPDPGIQPMTRIQLGGQDRQRARPKKKPAKKAWSWGESGGGKK